MNRLIDESTNREILLFGLDSIDVSGGAIPGDFAIIDDNATTLCYAERNGAVVSAAVASEAGKGRVVYFSHPGYFDPKVMKDGAKQLFLNAIKWCAKGKPSPRIAVLRDAGVVEVLKGLGYGDAVNVESPDFAGYDIILARGYREGDAEKVVDFVKAGGGLVGASLGWGYMYFNPSADFANDFLDNRVCAELGFLAGKSYTGRIDGAYPARLESRPVGVTVKEALAEVARWNELTDDERAQALAPLSVVIDALPDGFRPELRAAIDKATESPELERLAVLARRNRWLADPEKPVAADPLARVYPGEVEKVSAEKARVEKVRVERAGVEQLKIEKDIEIDLKVPRWHSTGLYAVAGEGVTVTVPEGAEKLGLKVRIGTTMDDLTGLAKWNRAPTVTCEVPLVKPSTTVYSPFGGLVYIVVPEKVDNSTMFHDSCFMLHVAGAIMSPRFKLGRDTQEKFARECVETAAPWGEIEGDEFIITAETKNLAQVDDAKWIAEYWDTVLREDRLLAGRESRAYPERYTTDVQLTAGDLHNGYPLMGHIEPSGDITLDKAKLARGEAWGIYHEIGHNHQLRSWTPACCGEVTVNLFTVLALEKAAHCDWRDDRFTSGRGNGARRVDAWVRGGKGFENWKKDYFLQLELYLRLLDAYGFDAYRRVITRYEKKELKPNEADDADIFNVFIRAFSDEVKENLAPVFAAWSIPVTDETREYCSRYPAADKSLIEGL